MSYLFRRLLQGLDCCWGQLPHGLPLRLPLVYPSAQQPHGVLNRSFSGVDVRVGRRLIAVAQQLADGRHGDARIGEPGADRMSEHMRRHLVLDLQVSSSSLESRADPLKSDEPLLRFADL